MRISLNRNIINVENWNIGGDIVKDNKDRAFLDEMMEPDVVFLDECIEHMTVEELQRFLDANPDFLKD